MARRIRVAASVLLVATSGCLDMHGPPFDSGHLQLQEKTPPDPQNWTLVLSEEQRHAFPELEALLDTVELEARNEARLDVGVERAREILGQLHVWQTGTASYDGIYFQHRGAWYALYQLRAVQ